MRGSTIFRRSLALVLTVVMLVSCWVFTAPTAEAATAGSYNVVVKFNVSDSCGSKYTEDNYITITYKANNGTGSESTKTWDLDGIVTSGGEKTVSATLGGYPTKVKLNVNNQQGSWKVWDRDTVKVKVHTVTVQGTTVWTGTIELESDVLEHSESKDIGNSPYAASITAISGSDSVSVKTDGKTSNTASYTLGTVKDQYGVNWYQDASWDTATVSNGVSFSNGTLTVPASSNRANNYTVTLKEKYGNASNTKTVTIAVFDYKVTFYDENGTTVLKAEQNVDYGGSATAPSSPTKAYDSSKHYTFNTWTGDTYQNITSGAQTKTVKASYTGTNHSYNQTSVHVDSGTGKTLKTPATCTDAAVYYNTCTCGRIGNTNTHEHGSALGHNFTDKSVRDDTTRKTAPTCTTDGEYYYGCSRCDAISHNIEGKEDMFYTVDTEGETGYRLGHKWGDVKSYQAEDDTPGYTYYECARCEKFCAADYDVTKNSYKADESTIYNEQSSVEADTDKIPDPYFNDGGSTVRFYDSIDYSTRPASFKYDTSDESQTIRFAGSVKVPEGVSWQVGSQNDNVVTDFGFVYTQTKYICDYNSEAGKYIDGSNPNPSKLYYDESKIAVKGKKGYKIYQMSVLDDSSYISQVNNGFSHHQASSSGGTADYLTFNLVIGVNVGNWGKEYAARPYITYKYHGLTYTVYDGGASNTDENMKYSHRSVTDLAEDIMYFDPFDEGFAKSMKYDYGLDYNGYKALVQNYKKDKAYALKRYFKSRMTEEEFEELIEEKCFNDDGPWWLTADDIDYYLDPEQSAGEGNYKGPDWYNNEIQNN